MAQITQPKYKVKPVLIFSKDGKPSLPVHEVIRMASAKAKGLEGTKEFIKVRAVRFVEECGVYVCLYESHDGYPVSPVLEKGLKGKT